MAELVDAGISERCVTLAEWLDGRRPTHLSTNSGAEPIAFQWRNFKEAFAPELVAQAFEETSLALGRDVRNCIDPFGGSGTTALASQFLGVSPLTVEVNPYLADLIEAKLARYDLEALLDDYSGLLDGIVPFSGDPFPGAPATFVEPGVNGRYLFSMDVAAEFASIRKAVDAVKCERHQRLFRVLLASISITVSNAVVSGKGRRYRRGWQDRRVAPGAVLEHFDRSVAKAVYDINRYANRPCLDYEIRRGDCRELIPEDAEFDMAVFSPPYPNSFDYTDVYNVELWTCGYLSGKAENRALRMSTLRSHVQIHRSYETPALPSERLKEVVSRLEAVRSSLWNPGIPQMVRAYFGDMNKVLSDLSSILVKNGRAYCVVGDSRYQDIQVPVGEILCELAEPLGLRKVGAEPFRSMRASPQQGGRLELLETLLIFERA